MTTLLLLDLHTFLNTIPLSTWLIDCVGLPRERLKGMKNGAIAALR